MNRRAEILLHLERRLSAPPEILMRRLDVGARTIANDVQDLNTVLAGAASVRLDKGRYRLWVIDRERYAQLRGELVDPAHSFNDPMTRVGYALSRLIRADVPVLTEDLAREMSIGRSTAIVDLARLREQAAPYGIRVLGRPHAGLELDADEFAVRLLVLGEHYETVYAGYPLDDELARPLDDAVAEFQLGVRIAEEIRRWYTVMLDRALTGHGLEHLPEAYHRVTELPAYDFGRRVTDAVQASIQIDLHPAEAVFLALPLAGMHTPRDESRLARFPVADEIPGLVQRILDQISVEMGIRIPPTALLKEFVHHLTFMVNRLRFRVPSAEVAAADLRTAYPVAFRMASIASTIIERDLELTITDDELGFIASYFQVFLEERKTSSTPAYRVAVVTPVGRVSARLLQLQLAKILAETTQYTLLSLDEAFPETLNTFDLVVSTTAQPLHTSSALIQLAEVFDPDELLGHINRLRFDQQAAIPLGASSRSLLATLLGRDRFVVLDPAASYRQNLDAMIDRLVELDLVDEEFRTALHERESRASMALDPYIAFPHATLPGHAERIVFALGAIPRDAGEPGLRMIVLMGVPEKADYDDTVLVDVYDEIIRLAADHPHLDQLCRLNSYEQVFLHLTSKPDNPQKG
ncbi:MAG: PRD domain-containing protein [Micropruina sp.]|uniref:BglG family transcription antiterminator n=1 Tax=Micropruina sp. TaxID=2737536 RepID=UPI0039E3545B